MLTYRWIVQASGMNPSAFHWVNLVLHLMVSSAVYLLFWSLTRSYGISLSGAGTICLAPNPHGSSRLDCFASRAWLCLVLSSSVLVFHLESATRFPEGGSSQKEKTSRSAASAGQDYQVSVARLLACFVCHSVAIQGDGIDFADLGRSLLFTFEPGKFSCGKTGFGRVSSEVGHT
jgi:hypothetical protein